MANTRAGRAGAGPLMVLGIVAGIGFIALLAWFWHGTGGDNEQRYAALMNSGATFLSQGDAMRAVETFQQARAMNPANPDVHVNLANAYLRANQPAQAALHAGEAAHLEQGSGAGPYLLGCALLRQNQYSNAVQSLQVAKDLDRTMNAVSFQLGRAYAGWGRFQDAADQFAEVIQFDTNHPSAHYQLSQMLTRLGQRERAAEALEGHRKATAGRTLAADDPSVYERCDYTQPRVPASLEQPEPSGVRVRFADQTTTALGTHAARMSGPVATLDVNRRGWNDLVVLDGAGIRILWNSNAVFSTRADPLPLPTTGTVRTLLPADINNDRYTDLVVVGDNGAAVVRLATNGVMSDATRISNLGSIPGAAGAFIDFEFTGKLGLALLPKGGPARLFRGFGNLAFRDATATSGIPANLVATAVAVDDWNNDDLPDLFFTRPGLPPLVVFNQRGGPLTASNQPAGWPAGIALATGDVNNDLRTDVAILDVKSVDLFLGGMREPRRIAARNHRLRQLRFLDFDNDGWPDLLGWGDEGLRLWRNRGRLGFDDVTSSLGLAGLPGVDHVLSNDFDRDGDPDLLLSLSGGGLRFLRNDGGNANQSIKARLLGNRSNAGGLGARIEVRAGSWRTLRTVQPGPVEIGVGKHARLDSVTVRWFDTQLPSVDIPVEPQVTLELIELTVPSGSCPYLYAWDGERFAFVTDLLGAAPVGLPVAKGRFIEADPEEFVRVGTDATFPRRNGRRVLQVTEELREILYLDAVRLVAVDHPAGIEVHPTSKLVPGRPFPPHGIVGVHRPLPLLRATRLAGDDVTAALQLADGIRVSPPGPPDEGYRGMAGRHGVVLDFGPLPVDEPLSLVMEGWLRFGGGMANIAASQREDFGFPFPVLEAEQPDGSWRKVPVTVGAPAGKTKSIVVPLDGHVVAGMRRLRLTQEFEIHWDRIALMRPAPAAAIARHELQPVVADLHARGYSEFAYLPWTTPLTPVYDRLLARPNWRFTPSGWVTRPGDVRELLAQRDQGLALLAGGDELTLAFDDSALPPTAPGRQRTFFLWTVGWDKDADYHVARGNTVEPLPWSGMDDQRHGVEARPSFPSDALHERFNTRWIGPRTVARRPAVNP
ncbi:MAG: FG-GAP-like repeat-containing protein [Verrucomicrobiota bacterium]